jgi:hypothetical protein
MARLLTAITVLALATTTLPGADAADSVRVDQRFNKDWRFHMGSADNAQQPGFEDEDWRALKLPHDWSVEQPFAPEKGASGTGYLPGGIGWYRKTFTVPAHWQGKRLFIEFEGVYRNSEVWINGHHLGRRPSGYTGFHYELTPRVNFGEPNVVAVRVQRRNVADSRWYPGSGIYRNVWLKVRSPVHIRRFGTAVRTPRVTDEEAAVSINTTAVNDKESKQSATLTTTIVSPGGREFPTQQRSHVIDAGESYTFAQWGQVEAPKRWSVDQPRLYRAVTRLSINGELRDRKVTRFGIRSFHFHPDRGFFLNGESTTLKGVCLHHDAGPLGAAVPRDVLKRRLKLLKNTGVNAVRAGHTPMSPAFYQLCDQLGLLVMDEAFDEWMLGKRKWVGGRNVGGAEGFGYNRWFEQWAERDLATLVRRNRNRPSVIMWSIGNEIDYPDDPYVFPPPRDDDSAAEAYPDQRWATRLTTWAPRLIATAKRHDPTRPVLMALAEMPTSNRIGLPEMLDAVGYNYQPDRYERDHEQYPDRVILGSENGDSLASWRAVTENDFVAGQFLWTGYDYLGEASRWPDHGFQSGLFDTRGYLKPIGHWRKALWSEDPHLHVHVAPEEEEDQLDWEDGTAHWSWPDHIGEPMKVAVSANTEEVTIRRNDQIIDTVAPGSDRRATVEVTYRAGTLTAVSKADGKVIARDQLTTPGEPSRIKLTVDRETLAANGRDVAHVKAKVVDSNGRIARTAEQPITIEVSGVGQLLGVDNGNLYDTTPLFKPTKRAHNGFVLGYVQARQTSGSITVEASAPGLETTTTTLASEPPDQQRSSDDR